MYVLSRDNQNFLNTIFFLPVVRHEYVAKVFLGKQFQHFPTLTVLHKVYWSFWKKHDK